MIKKILKSNLVIMLAIGFIALLSACTQTKKEECMNPSGFCIEKGTNLSHWLSQDFGWSPKYEYIKEKDIRFIDSLGFDHVRIPIDEQELWDENNVKNDVAFGHLNSCLDWCEKYGLRAIVDLHIVRTHHFNAVNEGGNNTLWTDPAAQQRVVDIWIELSDVLKKRKTDMVAYEILNEAVAPEHDDWNKLMNQVVAAIREREPERVIVIGPNMWQIAPNLQYLKLPEGDKNIILSFHTYSPLAFTHYKAEWTSIKDYKGKVNYPGVIITEEDYKEFGDSLNESGKALLEEGMSEWNKERLIDVYRAGLEFANSKGLQLFCGEFGCLPTVDRNDRLQYYSDMLTGFKENNIAWCNWEYKGDFGLYYFDVEKKESGKADYEFINVLLK
ncbi:MAG: cellulase family glycosylhydrolase [Prolixibacteraceae bacterium]|nr:cellulase family glycosylhydrolase [Prolixibacteraceae bacterium]